MRYPHTSMLLTLSTLSAFTLALPAPPTSPALTLLQALRADVHCGMVTCPGGGPDGHAFCERIGCDYCVVVASSPPTTHYECDGLRRALPGEVSSMSERKGNGLIETA